MEFVHKVPAIYEFILLKCITMARDWYSRAFLFLMFHYTKHQLWQVKNWKCSSKCKSSNARFDDKITTRDVFDLLVRFDFKCAYCAIPLPPKTWQLDHFYPRALGGLNQIQNLCPSCKWCNQMKNALDGFAFLHKCKSVCENNLIEKMFGKPY